MLPAAYLVLIIGCCWIMAHKGYETAELSGWPAGWLCYQLLRCQADTHPAHPGAGSGLCTPAKPQHFTGRLRVPSCHQYSLILYALRLLFSYLFPLLLLAYPPVRADREDWDVLSLLSVEQARSQTPANWWKGRKYFCQSQGWDVYQEVIYSALHHICIFPGAASFQAAPQADLLSASLALLFLDISSCG